MQVRRKLQRERRAAQLNQLTKEAMRRQKERERTELMHELIQYFGMMVSDVRSQCFVASHAASLP